MGVGGGEGERGRELAVIVRVVGEGAAYPLTHWAEIVRSLPSSGLDKLFKFLFVTRIQGCGSAYIFADQDLALQN